MSAPATLTVAGGADTACVVVWSKPSCMQCLATKRALERAGVPYVEHRLPERPDMVDRFRQAGLMQAPVVQAPGGRTWCGFRPDLIDNAAARLGGAGRAA